MSDQNKNKTINEKELEVLNFWNENLRFIHSILNFSNRSVSIFTDVSVWFFSLIYVCFCIIVYTYMGIM